MIKENLSFETEFVLGVFHNLMWVLWRKKGNVWFFITYSLVWHHKQTQLDELVRSRRLIKINGGTCGNRRKGSIHGLTCCYRNVYARVPPRRTAARFIAYRWKEKLLVKRARCSGIPKQKTEWIKKEAHKRRSIWVSGESVLKKKPTL